MKSLKSLKPVFNGARQFPNEETGYLRDRTESRLTAGAGPVRAYASGILWGEGLLMLIGSVARVGALLFDPRNFAGKAIRNSWDFSMYK